MATNLVNQLSCWKRCCSFRVSLHGTRIVPRRAETGQYQLVYSSRSARRNSLSRSERRTLLLRPGAATRAGDNSFDNTHVRDSVGKRRWRGCIIQNRAGENIGLKRVLIANVEANLFGRSELRASLLPDAARPVGRCVKWNFDLDPASS